MFHHGKCFLCEDIRRRHSVKLTAFIFQVDGSQWNINVALCMLAWLLFNTYYVFMLFPELFSHSVGRVSSLWLAFMGFDVLLNNCSLLKTFLLSTDTLKWLYLGILLLNLFSVLHEQLSIICDYIGACLMPFAVFDTYKPWGNVLGHIELPLHLL